MQELNLDLLSYKKASKLYFLQSRDPCILEEEHTVTMTIYIPGYKPLNDSSGSAKADQSLKNLISLASARAHCDKFISLIPNLEYVRMA